MDNKNGIKLKNPVIATSRNKKPKFLSLADSLISDLSPRSQEIVRKRFGLSNGKRETLEQIGRQYGITRERVRQILSEAIKNISSELDSPVFLEAEEKIIFTIKSNDGIIKESDIIEKFNTDGQVEANAIKFFVSCSKKILEIEEKVVFEKSWIVSKEVIESAKKVISEAVRIIQEEKKLLEDQEIFEKVSSLMPQLGKKEVMNFLKIAVAVKKNKFGKWGMFNWMEVRPKGTREKVYLILKEQKKPLHFTEIADLIDKFQLGKRKAHPQTVHNELIKDKRFILIGRGIYALAEWGYFEGTIREIIQTILEKNAKPMSKEEIMAEVLKMRKVKKTTIMINLNNRKFFEKKGEFYALKK